MVVKMGIVTLRGILKKGEKYRSALLICFDVMLGKENSSLSEKGFISHSIIFAFVSEENECNWVISPSNRKLFPDCKNQGKHPRRYAPIPLSFIIRQSIQMVIIYLQESNCLQQRCCRGHNNLFQG
jgi:hypothetical protein